MWLLGCNLRRDLYILFSVKRIFVTVDRIFIDLCNPRRHKNIWKGPYFIQTRGPWHNLWQIMSFSTLTFCARVWNIANMLRYKVVSGENVIGGPGPGRRSLLTPDWTNRKLECPDQRRHQGGRGRGWHYTCHSVMLCANTPHTMFDICLTYATHKIMKHKLLYWQSMETRALSIIKTSNKLVNNWIVHRMFHIYERRKSAKNRTTKYQKSIEI